MQVPHPIFGDLLKAYGVIGHAVSVAHAVGH
ncbi:Uncharacterised protein [Vibrio cholerae]|nr:Uncharacterised protein [Vibrio cholerae]